MNKNKTQNSKGITLVALIITIIVMLILVGVSITIAIRGNLFNTTKRAAKGTKAEIEAEQELSNGRVKIDGIWYDSLEDYAIGRESAIQGVEDLTESNTTFIYTPSGWTNGEVKVTINTTALTSGFRMQYSTDGLNWSDYTAGTEIPVDRNVEIFAKMIDSEGNEGGSVSGNVKNIDTEKPTINTHLNSTGAAGTDIPLSINVTDSNSGISKIEWYYKENSASTYEKLTNEYVTMNGTTAGEKTAVTKETTLTELTGQATYNIYAMVYDVAGNSTRSPAGTETINITTQTPEDMDMIAYNNAAKDVNGVLLSNVTVRYKPDGRTAVVPKGFKIVTGIEGTKSIVDGLVIQDKDGNEFVWVPVEVVSSDTETSIASFYRSEWVNNARGTSLKDSTTYTEPYANGYEGEPEEYAEMVKSVYKNKGFYIGRYEAGSTTQRTGTGDGTTGMVVKKDQFPYNYINWGASTDDYASDVMVGSNNQGKGAAYLSKNMYEGKDVGVTSTLCYGVQWDAMLDFIKDESYNVTNGGNWGSYTAVQNTGSSDLFAVKNIFDFYGNVAEFTMETGSDGRRIMRGGNAGMNRSFFYASFREPSTDIRPYIRFQSFTLYKINCNL